MGIVEIVEHLSTVQDKVYDEPTVLVVDNVTGEQGHCLHRGGGCFFSLGEGAGWLT